MKYIIDFGKTRARRGSSQPKKASRDPVRQACKTLVERTKNSKKIGPTTTTVMAVTSKSTARIAEPTDAVRWCLSAEKRQLTAWVAFHPNHGDNRFMENPGPSNPFQPGTMVVTTLANPREKFWGAILSLSPEGLSLRGIELPSFEDLVALVRDGEPFTLGVVFFPMHRVERMELDLPDGNIPSLSQRFTAKTGLDPVTLLRAEIPVPPARERA